MPGYVKSIRNHQVLALIEKNHHAFCLLWIIANRAKRTLNEDSELSLGEAWIGDHDKYNMTQQEYRTAKKHLEKCKFATFKATNRGTIATLCDTSIFDINIGDGNKQPNKQVTSKQRASNDKQEVKKERKEEHRTISSVSAKPPRNGDEADVVLAYLNQRTGKSYRDKKSILARLNDGATIEQCKQVIDTKGKDPYFTSNPRYMNPTTLFRPTHWDIYLNERTSDYQRSTVNGNGSTTGRKTGVHLGVRDEHPDDTPSDD